MPDGTRLLMAEADPTRRGGAAVLGLLSMDRNRRVSRLGEPAISGINAEISPDGRWLAYESDETGEVQVYVRPFPVLSQGRSQVSTNGGREPLWARSGRELFYRAPDGTLMAVPVEVGPSDARFSAGIPAAVIPARGYYTEAAFHRGRAYDVSPDAARFLRIKIDESSPSGDDGSRHFVIVENWFEDLKRLAPTH
jgi:serine/threonine-protein kinase